MTARNSRYKWMAVLLIGGGIYGFFGAWMNSNPYLPDGIETSHGKNWTSEDRARQDFWMPSPVWITSYVLCRAQVGITYTRSGYLFRNASDRNLYFACSTAIGTGAGLVGLIFVALFKKSDRG